jgi:hypothetical protein
MLPSSLPIISFIQPGPITHKLRVNLRKLALGSFPLRLMLRGSHRRQFNRSALPFGLGLGLHCRDLLVRFLNELEVAFLLPLSAVFAKIV